TGKDHHIAQHIKVGESCRVDGVLAGQYGALFEEQVDRVPQAKSLDQPLEVGDVLERTWIVRARWTGNQQLHAAARVANAGRRLNGPLQVLAFGDPDRRQHHGVGAEQTETSGEGGGLVA